MANHASTRTTLAQRTAKKLLNDIEDPPLSLAIDPTHLPHSP
jgi:hypothetical protein